MSRAFVGRLAAAFILVWSGGFVSSGSAGATEATFPPGSHVGLVPPTGFITSQTFRGFEDRDKGASILMLEMPAGAFAEIDKAMTDAALKRQGVTLEKRENLMLKTGRAVLMVGRQDSSGEHLRKWILLAPLPNATAMLTVQMPDAARSAYPDSVIHSALASLAVREKVPIDEQLALLPFHMDNLGGLRPFRVVQSSTVFLTEGPLDTVEPAEQPLLVVSIARGGPEQPSERNEFARNLLTSVAGLRDMRFVGADLLRLGTQQVHEIMAEAKDVKTGSDLKLVQWLRFGSGGFVRLIGASRSDAWRDAFPRFRAVRDGIAPR
ncbi:MAG TPA: hypothetical protein VHA77_16685 [Xanthobacteraceae bacterium]|jgi:hypothetical protein|nr:hypothetical protein [Xanthobacteraceae bacterium]